MIVISPFLVQAFAIALNFNPMLQGSAANAANIVVSLCYIAFWVCFIHTLKRCNAQRGLHFSLVLWLLVLLTSLLTLSVNVFDYDLPWAIPLTILFLTPTYGVRIAQFSNVAALAIMALIAGAFLCYCLVRQKQKN